MTLFLKCNVVQQKRVQRRLAEYPLVLKRMYDLELLDEVALVKRYDTAAAKAKKDRGGGEDFKACRAKAKPFIEWLQNAEEVSGDDDDDDDDEEEE